MQELLLNLLVVTSATTKKAPQAANTEPSELKLGMRSFLTQPDIFSPLSPISEKKCFLNQSTKHPFTRDRGWFVGMEEAFWPTNRDLEQFIMFLLHGISTHIDQMQRQAE